MRAHRINAVRRCKTCGTSFDFYACPSNEAQGRGQFCSVACRGQFARRPLAERFAVFAGEPNGNGCILWTGAKMPNGYGKILGGHGRILLAHRAAWVIAFGDIPDGKQVLHRCDVRACVNVMHLFLGTDSINAQDKAQKGRAPRGEGHVRSRLTAAQVRDMRDRYRSGANQYDLAKHFRVSQSIVSRIVNRIDWAHLD